MVNREKLKQMVWRSVETLEGWCGQDRCDALVDLIYDHTPYMIVEVGVYGGRSLVAMDLATHYVNPVSHVWGIDPWTNEANLEGEPNEHRTFWETVDMNRIYLGFIEAHLDRSLTCQHIRARGEDVTHLFPDGSIDLLGLDGNHSELSSCRDVQLWLPKLAEGAHLVMDDTSWPSMQKAVGLVKDAGWKVMHDGGSWAVFSR